MLPRSHAARLPRAGRSHPSSLGMSLDISRGAREGLTLLEVLVSLAIFLLALVGIARLISLGNERALDVQDEAEALQRCQSKLSEVVSGATPLQSMSDTPFDDQTSWRYTLECSETSVKNLWSVRITVSRQRFDGATPQVTLAQLVLDPTIRGSTTQPSPAEDTTTTTTSP